jgi:hypothetical protein
MNKYMSHIYVIPEDDANRQLADGFVLHHQVKDTRIQVMPPAGGWTMVLKAFQDEYIQRLRNYTDGHVVMLIDFDDEGEPRKARFDEEIPDDLKNRVFVIGAKNTPEALKAVVNMSFEAIGMSLANDCDDGNSEHWDHEQLQHNDDERQRLVQTVRPFLF